MAIFAILGGTATPAVSAAAYTIGSRVETSSFLLVFALNVAAATLVGQCLGASDPERAERACWRMTHLATGAMVVVGLGMFVGAEHLASLFTSDPQVIKQTGAYLRALALSEPFMAAATVLSGALQGAGSTRSPLVIATGTQFALGLPLAYLLAHPGGMAASGVWWALALSNVAQGVLVLWWFQRGRWRHKTV
jgi:Na+-driven multidrug efflux pump